MTDKLLDYGLEIVRESLAGNLTHDPATAIEALQRLMEVTCMLEKDYRAAFDDELKQLSKEARADRNKFHDEVRARANRAAAEAYHVVMMEALRGPSKG
jgi:hypothetical protein